MTRLCFAAGLLALAAAFPTPVLCQQPLFQDRKQPAEMRAHDLVQRMSAEEKIAQMMNAAPAIPRLGVPAYNYWSEGLHGVARSGYATLFPQAIGLAATWDPALQQQIGGAIAEEARAKYNRAVAQGVRSIYFGLTIWSPNINIFRDPRWGRGQETYGEDPFLTSRMGTAFIRGLQGDDPSRPITVATPKHFAVHSGPEASRHTFNAEPSAHDLWDTYLPAFRAAVVDGHAASLMCAYNAIDGVPACANPKLLNQVLRHDWGFSGFVTSDCGAIDDVYKPEAHHFAPDAATAAATSVKAGTDTNCGRTYTALGEASGRGLVTAQDLDTAVERLFTARFKLGLFDEATPEANTAQPADTHHDLALKAAESSMVLLKNDGLLPIDPGRFHSVAVIGPNAASLASVEGNYNAIPREPSLPVDALEKLWGPGRVHYAQGASYAEGATLPVPRTMLRPAAASRLAGLQARYFDGDATAPALTRVDRELDFDWNGAQPVPGIRADNFRVEWTGELHAPAPGDYNYSFQVPQCSPCFENAEVTVWIDGRQAAHGETQEAAEYHEFTLAPFRVHFAGGEAHRIRVLYRHQAKLFGAGLRLVWSPPAKPLLAEALAAARQSDLVIAFVGLSPDLEGEEMPVRIDGFSGGDRTSIDLPATQQALLESLAATGKPLVVVLMNGSALAVNWAQQHANAVLEAWYPGEAGGEAIARTLDGRNNPAGRLPVTFYASTEQLPAFDDYNMANRTYRYFRGQPLYGFGFGLSYSSFRYTNLHTEFSHAADQPLRLSVTVTNSSDRDGDEVVEAYIAAPADRLRPHHALVAFERVHVPAHSSREVPLEVQPRGLSTVDAEGVRRVVPGTYRLSVGGGEPGTPGAVDAEIEVRGSYTLPR